MDKVQAEQKFALPVDLLSTVLKNQGALSVEWGEQPDPEPS
jgi:hypothetical protein